MMSTIKAAAYFEIVGDQSAPTFKSMHIKETMFSNPAKIPSLMIENFVSMATATER
jgi:hypothetical protein